MHDRKHLKERRKTLRNYGTSAEAFLWKHLSKSQLKGRKFRRQHSIENYIVDFYCSSEKLIIELDGQTHDNHIAEENDDIRDTFLNNLGFRVLRFENKLVFDDLHGVLNEIASHFTK